MLRRLFLFSPDLQTKAVAEDEREEQITLELEEGGDEELDEAIERTERGQGWFVMDGVGHEGKIDDEDTQQAKAADEIQKPEAGRRGGVV